LLRRWSNSSLARLETVGNAPYGIALDGAYLWVTNAGASGRVSKIRASDGVFIRWAAVGVYPQAIAFDGANVWVANRSSNSVSRR
jgi:DNA-binding beta-propeller fold protein YncE